MKVIEMLEKRAGLITEARALHEKAEAEKREPTAEEREQFDKLMAQADVLKADAARAEKLETEERELSESRGRQTALEQADGAGKDKDKGEKPEVRMFELAPSIAGETRAVTIDGETATQEYVDMFCRYLRTGEARALQKDSDTAGGYLSAPVQFQAELIKAVDDLTFMRSICRVLPPISSAETLGAPALDANPADPTWTNELNIGSEDSTLSFGKRELTPHPLAQYIKVSKTLLRRSTLSADTIVRDRLAYKTAVVMENAFLNGDGSTEPLGVFTASALGISTGQDVSTGNTTTAVTTDGLKEAKYSLPEQYRRGCGWVFHRDIVKMIAKLKDGEGQYIWKPGIVENDPDRLLGFPINESEYAPSTIATSAYVGILGNFQQYWIVDALTMTIQVLVELYAATNQNGYISRLESDGMPVLEDAFARVQLAAS